MEEPYRGQRVDPCVRPSRRNTFGFRTDDGLSPSRIVGPSFLLPRRGKKSRVSPPATDNRHQDSAVAAETWRHFRQLIEALPAAVYTTDAAGRITFYNEAAAELSGHRPELGRDLWCVSWRLRRPDGTPLPHDECPMAIALREDRPVRGVAVIAERPDGTRVHLLLYPTPLHDSSGVLIGAVNMLIDITERKQAEAAVRQLNETLEQRIEQRSQMMAQAFDELRVSE